MTTTAAPSPANADVAPPEQRAHEALPRPAGDIDFGDSAAWIVAGPLEQDPRPRQMSLPIRWGYANRLSVRVLLAGLAMAGVAVWATWSAWVDAWALADITGDNNHVFLAPLVVIWLFWVRRGRLPHIRVTGRWLGLVVILAGWLVRTSGLSNNVAAAFHLGSLLVVIGAFMSVCGKGSVLRFLPAAAALLFLIPVPQKVRQELAIPLQTTTAWLTDGVLDVMGVQSQVAGNTLIVNGKSVMIAEACNGMPMVFGLLLVTFAFAFAWPLRNSVRWMLLILSPIVTLGCNVLRTVPLVWAYGNGRTDVFDWLHAYSSWLMLPLAFVLLLGVLRAMRWLDLPVDRYRLAAQ